MCVHTTTFVRPHLTSIFCRWSCAVVHLVTVKWFLSLVQLKPLSICKIKWLLLIVVLLLLHPGWFFCAFYFSSVFSSPQHFFSVFTFYRLQKPCSIFFFFFHLSDRRSLILLCSSRQLLHLCETICWLVGYKQVIPIF